jgi:hypothetical protein
VKFFLGDGFARPVFRVDQGEPRFGGPDITGD